MSTVNYCPEQEDPIFCHLCLTHLLREGRYFKLEGIKKDMLEVIVPDLQLAIPNNSLICVRCFKSLEFLFNFKTMCLENDDYLQNYVDSSNKKVDLEKVVQEKAKPEKRKNPTTHSQNERGCSVCRLCFQGDSSQRGGKTIVYYVEKEPFLANLVKGFLPELVLNITENPVICRECLELLNKYLSFAKKCQTSQEKIPRTTNKSTKRKNPLLEVNTELSLVKKQNISPDIGSTSDTNIVESQHICDSKNPHSVLETEKVTDRTELDLVKKQDVSRDNGMSPDTNIIRSQQNHLSDISDKTPETHISNNSRLSRQTILFIEINGEIQSIDENSDGESNQQCSSDKSSSQAIKENGRAENVASTSKDILSRDGANDPQMSSDQLMSRDESDDDSDSQMLSLHINDEVQSDAWSDQHVSCDKSDDDSDSQMLSLHINDEIDSDAWTDQRVPYDKSDDDSYSHTLSLHINDEIVEQKTVTDKNGKDNNEAINFSRDISKKCDKNNVISNEAHNKIKTIISTDSVTKKQLQVKSPRKALKSCSKMIKNKQNTITDDAENSAEATARSIRSNSSKREKFNWACQMCSYKARTYNEYYNHFKNSHVHFVRSSNTSAHSRQPSDGVTTKPEPSPASPTVVNPANNKREHDNTDNILSKRTVSDEYQCDDCVFTTRFKWIADSHVCEHKMRENISFSCKVCNYSCLSVLAIESHMRSHASSEKKCSLCDNSPVLSQKRRFARHMRKHHVEVFNLATTCKVCNYMAITPTDLILHFRHEHRGEEALFFCKRCIFVGTSTLMLRGHTEKCHCRTVCPICKKKFYGKLYFKQHLEEKHPNFSRKTIVDKLKKFKVAEKKCEKVKEKKKKN